MLRRTTLRLLAASACAALLGGACLSPTLPLPPPEQPHSIGEGEDGLWAISGECTPGALVTIVNEVTGVGVVVEDREQNGRYRVDLPATRCDSAWVKQEQGEDVSGRTHFVVEERSPSAPGPSTCK